MSTAFHKAVDLLSRREHSEKEISQKLKLRGFSKVEIDEALVKLKEYQYISNERYGRLLYRSLKKKGFGLRRIEQKFKEKGIVWNKDLLALDTDEAAPSDEENIKHWIEKKSRFMKSDEDPRKTYEKLVSFLIRKGFSYEASQKEVKKFLESKKK